MRDKNKGTARRMLLPRGNRPESPRRTIRDRLSHSGEEYGPLRWDVQLPDAKHPAYAKCHESSWDFVARPMITRQQIAERTAIADARSSRGAAKFISPARKRWVPEKIIPSPVGATLSGAALSPDLILVGASPSGSRRCPAVKDVPLLK